MSNVAKVHGAPSPPTRKLRLREQVAVHPQAMRNPARQAVLSRLVRQPTTDVAVLDRAGATAVGALLAATNTRDIADAHVVLCAARARQAIVTTEAGELRRLAPRAAIVAL